jgi:hypothetical protein
MARKVVEFVINEAGLFRTGLNESCGPGESSDFRCWAESGYLLLSTSSSGIPELLAVRSECHYPPEASRLLSGETS